MKEENKELELMALLNRNYPEGWMVLVYKDEEEIAFMCNDPNSSQIFKAIRILLEKLSIQIFKGNLN